MSPDLFLLVIVRQHQAFTKSPFNCYYKQFGSYDGKSAEDRFWEWWNNLPASSYTKRMCKVQFVWCTMESYNPLTDAPKAPVIPLRPA